jgi:3',5'-cyclic AMP phosphodiesterase CpdA
MTVRLIHMTDIHFNIQHPQAVEAATAFAHETPHDLVILSGDITQAGLPEEFTAVAAWIERLPKPLVVCPGNHDTTYYNVPLRILKPWGRYRHWIGPTEEVEHQSPGLYARTLNTARGIQLRRNWSKGLADLDEFRRAGEALNRAPPECLRVLVCHHPLMEVLGEPITAEVRRGKQAAAILAEHKVDLVVTGHLHVPFAVTLPVGDERTHAVGGSTMSLRERGAPIGFNVIEADADVIRVRALGWINDKFELVKSWSLPRRTARAPDAQALHPPLAVEPGAPGLPPSHTSYS